MSTLESTLSALLAKLDAPARRKLAQEVGKILWASQVKRIAGQKNPDGSAYVPRRPQKRPQPGRLKKKAMFAKLRTTRFLKKKATANSAEVGFVGRVGRIARVHQDGLNDKTSQTGPSVRYAQRQLLGFTSDDIHHIESLVLTHLSK